MRNHFLKILLVPVLVGALVGCLRTRNDVRENEQHVVMQQQVSTMQRTNADALSRFDDLQEELRTLNGRVDIVENKIEKSFSNLDGTAKSTQQREEELNEKVAVLQDALVKMEKEIDQLRAEVQSAKSNQNISQNMSQNSISSGVEKGTNSTAKDSYSLASDLFTKKNWKQAILQFQKYREEKPKGPHFGEATYKIGVSFQELGLNDESKTFYDEVINKFPKSEEAKRAKVRLKSLHK